jgi:hypothetical protein
MINIIHLRDTDWSNERYNSFMKELSEQGIIDYKIWDGFHGPNRVVNINRSHKQIVSYAKEKGLPEICIGEDDLYFLGNGSFEYFLQNKPDQYSLYLAGVSNVLRRENDYITDFRGFTLYMVHESFYDTYLSVPENINIDAAMKGLGEYYLSPKLICSQRAGYSYHKKRHTDYSHLLKQYNLYESDRND